MITDFTSKLKWRSKSSIWLISWPFCIFRHFSSLSFFDLLHIFTFSIFLTFCISWPFSRFEVFHVFTFFIWSFDGCLVTVILNTDDYFADIRLYNIFISFTFFPIYWPFLHLLNFFILDVLMFIPFWLFSSLTFWCFIPFWLFSSFTFWCFIPFDLFQPWRFDVFDLLTIFSIF